MTISETKISRMPTTKLEGERDRAEAEGNWELYEACEAELERREADASDPAYQAERQDAEDASAGLEDLGGYSA